MKALNTLSIPLGLFGTLMLLFLAVNSYAQLVNQEGSLSSVLLQQSTTPGLGPVKIEAIDAPGIAVAEDQQGFMWFAGNDGLYRFDGYDTIHYQHDPEDSTSLSETWVESLHVDSGGTLWVGTFGGGLNRFDPVTETFTHYRHDPAKPTSLSQDTVTVILENTGGQLWVGTHGGLNRLDKQAGTFTRYRHDSNNPKSLSNDQVRALYEDASGILWVGTGSPAPSETPVGQGGLNRFHPESQTFTRYLHDPDDPKSLINNKVMSLFEDSRGTFWVGTLGDGLHSMDRDAGTFTRYRYDPANPTGLNRPFETGTTSMSEECVGWGCGGVSFFYEDRQGMLWIGGFGGGLNRYDPETGAMSHHEQANSGLLDNNTWSVDESHDGTLWVGTWAGMHKVSASVNSFPHITSDPTNPAGLSGNSVLEIHEGQDGKIWFVLDFVGLDQLDRKTGEFRQFRYDPDDPDGVQSIIPVSIEVDQSGALWMGANGGGLLSRYDPESGRFTHFRSRQADPTSISSNVIWAIKESRGYLWLGPNGGGISRFDPSTGIAVHYRHDSANPASISNNRVWKIYEDNAGTLWAGTDNGLNRLVEGSEQDVIISRYLMGRTVTSIFEDRDGRFWVGTWGDGLHLLDRTTGQTQRLGPEDGLPSAKVAGILEDEEGYIWISTAEGQFGSSIGGRLSRFNPISETFTNFNSQNGLPAIGFSMNSALKTQDGMLFFGGDGGFTVFDPAAIREPVQRSPKMALTGLRVLNEEIKPNTEGPLTRPIHLAEEIRLSYSQNDFTIDYTALAFRDPDRVQYHYRLEPHDADWVSARAQRSARYSGLAPGSYVFQVRAVDSGGLQSEEAASILITVLPPWWRTWWAYGLYVLIFAAGVFAVDRFQRRRLIAKERAKAQERELEQEKKYSNQLKKAYSELEAAQGQLVQQEKLASLGQLTAGIAHEIKNPLNFVNNFSDLSAEMIEELIAAMKNGDVNEAEEIAKDISQNLNKIHEHGTRADGIVKSMLQHSRGGSGKMEPTNINALIKEYANLAFHGMRAGKDPIEVDIELELDENVGEVDLIAEDFSRVILNLCNNAFDAMREKANMKRETADSPFEGGRDGKAGQGDDSPGEYEPKLTVRTHKKDTSVTIEIEDNGPGIPDDIKDKILQPFFTTKKGTAGTGLGLSITHDIVKAHGGNLDVETDSSGTTFSITLNS